MYKFYDTIGHGLTSLARNSVSESMRWPFPEHQLKKWLMRTYITIALLCAAFLQISLAARSQSVTLSKKNAPIAEVFKEIRRQTGYDFVITNALIQQARPVTIQANAEDLQEVLIKCFADQPFTYAVQDKMIIIKPKTSSFLDRVIATFKNIDVRGQVLSPDGAPLIGASITLKGTTRTVISLKDGTFIFSNIDENSTLMISYLGYTTQEVKIKKDQPSMVIIMQLAENKMSDVIITGTGINRKKDSFTGAAVTFTGLELKAVGNRNVLESLRSLDPSFIKVENNLQGSNPNSMPTFEIMGQTTINTNTLNDQFSQDPNQPLFILDGFETTLQIINDLDMNRVSAITILKDAASTALYGAKAANGVVVVETKRPVPGKLQISYNADMTVEMPDLSSYNLMDAAEKLEYERLQGMLYQTGPGNEWADMAKYNSRLAEVQRGVNTYWLNEPVRTGLSHRHSLQFSGGNNDLLFNASASYGKQLGVMKGSGRETWGGNVGITYRKGKLNLNNTLSLTGSKADESPYGSFSAFAKAIPYYRKQLPDGTIPKYLDPEYDPSAVNPLYNVSQLSIDQTKDFTFFNNLDAIYTLSSKFRLQGGLQLTKGNSNSVQFIPPENTRFDGVELTQKGNYTNTHVDNNGYRANLMLNYGETIGKSQFSAAIRGDIAETNRQLSGYSAVGFPYGTNGNPVYAYGYTPDGTPAASTSKIRSAGVLASFSYAWDQRFLFDAVYRLDGASVFGTDHTFKPFVSGGIGWNFHQEPFLRNSNTINLLKIRANAGYTGNENLGQFSSVSTLSFQTGNNNTFGQGITLASLGNPTLDWQRTLQLSYGIDFGFFKNRISGYVEYFDKKTDPLAVGTEGTLPSSTGTGSSYVMNVGYLSTKGWNFNIRVQPVNIPAQRIIWSVGVMGSSYTSTYGGLSDKLAKLNEEQTASKGMIRFMDGYSPDDIWAVVSHGVDPATGKELFQKKDGTLSFYYSTDDIVKVGNSRPRLEGGINTTFTLHDFTFGAVARYRLGGDVFNNALYNKVENVGILHENVDKRALYDRWKQPGDISQFTSISSTSANLSSRFVQEDNHLIGESFSLNWRSYAAWIRDLKLQSISVTLYVNDIFRIEKIKSERGIDYPYARTGSLSINISF